jgi:hypothetical protein
MIRIKLDVITVPDKFALECFGQIKRFDGGYEPTTVKVDTGAQISTFPAYVLTYAEHVVIRQVEIEQAGIAGQVFTATEAFITLRLEDMQGNRTQDLSIRAWFANTSVALLGWRDLLEMGILHVDAPQRHATFELNPA